MATPHVAGVAALYLESDKTASAATVGAAITGSATPNVVTSPGPGSPNLLLYSLLAPVTPPPTAPAAPVANDDSAQATTGATVTIDVLANDTDANGDTLTVSSVSGTTGGTATISSGGTSVTYTAPGTAGDYTFTYTASDGSLTDGASVTVTVTEPSAGASEAQVTYTGSGGKTADKHLIITVTLTDAKGLRVAATSIAIEVTLNGSLYGTASGTTSSTGSVSWEIKNAPSGIYYTTVTRVAEALWNGTTTGSAYTKQ